VPCDLYGDALGHAGTANPLLLTVEQHGTICFSDVVAFALRLRQLANLWRDVAAAPRRPRPR